MADTAVGITVKVSKNTFRRLSESVDDVMHDLVETVCSDAYKAARVMMKGSPPTGRTYVRHGISHTASSSPMPPRVEPLGFSPTAGQLYAGIYKDVRGSKGTVYTKVDYARYLEYGTRKMNPRPFMRPAAKAAAKALPYRLKGAAVKFEVIAGGGKG